MQSAWGLSTPVGTANIVFSEGWFNPVFPYTPQITVTEMASVIAETKGTGGSTTAYYRPEFAVNVWVQIPVGSSGTQEAQNAVDIKKNVAKIFRQGYPLYGGSLSPFKCIIPKDDGIPRHEVDKTPRCLRYEVNLVGVQENE